MLDDYIMSKHQVLGGGQLSKKQIKDLERLKKDFKKHLSKLVKPEKKKRQVGAGQKKKLNERGTAVKHVMKTYNMTLPEASKVCKKLHDKGLSYSEISKMKN